MVKKNKFIHGHRKKTKKSSNPHGGSLQQGILQQAFALHNAGQLPQAENLYRKILLTEPNHPDALHYLGLLAHQVGKSTKAVELIRKALSCRTDYIEAHNSLGVVLNDQGKREEAVDSYRRALALRPNYAEVHSNLGNALMGHGQLDEAVASYRRAIALKPGYAEAHYNLGNALSDQGKLDEAVACYRQAITLKSDYVEAHYNLGLILNNQGKLDEAVASYQQVLALKPDYAEAYNNLGNTFRNQGKLDEAVASYHQTLSLKPDHAEAHYNLGKSLKDQGKLDEAVASYRRAITLKPEYVEAHNNLGLILNDQGKLDEAVASYRQALTLKPDYAEAHYNLGIALKRQGKLDEAVASYRQALTLIPEDADAHNNLGNILLAQGKLNEAIASFRRVLLLTPDYFQAHSNLLFALNYFPDQLISFYLEEARSYGWKATGKVSAQFSGWNCSEKPERLCVGMVSGDFRNHSVGHFLENVLSHIDHTRFDLVAYPTHFKEDELTARIRSHFVAWKPLLGLHDETAARQIHNDGVHVLLDLSGHTRHSRLPVFAWKPAPVQATWLGYSASTGLAEMDYLLADPYVVPPGEEAHFTESIWRLPESYLCFSPPHISVDIGPLPALKTGRITFGSFNNPTKMNDSVVALWSKVLHAVPGSLLFLKAKQFSDSAICETTRQRFATFGIPPDRLLLEGYIKSREDHLAAYNRMDIALDPFPYNGTTTSVEGLWMGVPFITCKGNCFISRVGQSIAHNTGMTDWIAFDHEDYVAKAVFHANNLEKLAQLRAGLRQRLFSSPLIDGPRFARNFETALWEMWHCFLDNQKAKLR